MIRRTIIFLKDLVITNLEFNFEGKLEDYC